MFEPYRIVYLDNNEERNVMVIAERMEDAIETFREAYECDPIRVEYIPGYDGCLCQIN